MSFLAACTGSPSPDRRPTPDALIESWPVAELSNDREALAALTAWAVSHLPAAVQYWSLGSVETPVDLSGFGQEAPSLFGGLPILGVTRDASDRVPLRALRRQDEARCPRVADASEYPTGRIDLRLKGGCGTAVGDLPIRYDGEIRVSGDFHLGNYSAEYEWNGWVEDTPFARHTVEGEQTLHSTYRPGEEYRMEAERELTGLLNEYRPLRESFRWRTWGMDSDFVASEASWLVETQPDATALRASIESRRSETPAVLATDGEVEVGGTRLALLTSSPGRIAIRFEGIRTGLCHDRPRMPHAGTLAVESLNTFRLVFADDCSGCALIEGRDERLCWTDPAPPRDPMPESPDLFEPAGGSASNSGAGDSEATFVEALPVISTDSDILPRQSTHPSGDLAVALPESYSAVPVEGDVTALFFHREGGVRGAYLLSAFPPNQAASQLAAGMPKQATVNGTLIPADSSLSLSTVTAFAATSAEGDPMSLSTYFLSFASDRSLESVVAQLAAVLGASAGDADVTLPNVPSDPKTGRLASDFVAVIGSATRKDGKNAHAIAAAPFDDFNTLSDEMFQSVGAATGASTTLTRYVETFTAAQAAQIVVNSNLVDILWVIDDSGSMSQEQKNLASNFDAFFTQLQAMGLDYHLGVTTTDCDVSGNCGALRSLASGAKYLAPSTPNAKSEWATLSTPGTWGSAFERPLLAAREALSSRVTDGKNAGFRRSGASLVVILVTDEIDQSWEGSYTYSYTAGATSPQLFIDFLAAQAATVFAITGDPADAFSAGGCSSTNGSADEGNSVIEVAQATGGAWASICSGTFAPTLSLISQAVGTAASQFKLARPAVPSRIRVFVEDIEARRSVTIGGTGAVTRTDGFIYDIVSRTISFVGSQLTPQPGQTVKVIYLAKKE
ncbi:MAG: VWA domain-containing protein [Nitrospirae bacterium]|nr:VWA domain-containing protein [Nitrospirota bacterium]